MSPARQPTSARQRLVGDRIRDHRRALKMSQEAMALASGVNRSYVASLEAGRRNPSLETLCRLALGLRCDVAELVGGAQAAAGRPKSSPS